MWSQTLGETKKNEWNQERRVMTFAKKIFGSGFRLYNVSYPPYLELEPKKCSRVIDTVRSEMWTWKGRNDGCRKPSHGKEPVKRRGNLSAANVHCFFTDRKGDGRMKQNQNTAERHCSYRSSGWLISPDFWFCSFVPLGRWQTASSQLSQES